MLRSNTSIIPRKKGELRHIVSAGNSGFGAIPATPAASGSSGDEGGLAGWYAGLGVNYAYTVNRATMDDNLGDVQGGVSNARDMFLSKTTKGKAGGYVNTGWGLMNSAWYFGWDLKLDIAGKTETRSSLADSRDPGMIYDCRAKNNGVVPTFAFEFGRYLEGLDALACLRIGTAYTTNEFRVITSSLTDNDGSTGLKIRNSKFVHVLGIKLKKRLSENGSVQLCYDYRLPITKQGVVVTISNSPYRAVGEVSTRTHNFSLGYIYNF